MGQLLRLIIIFIVAGVIVTASTPVFGESAENSWVLKAPMNEARWGLSLAVVSNRIYAIGGSTQNGISPYVGGIIGTNEEYDLSTDTWSFKARMPTPRYHFNAVVFQDKIFCIGGTLTNGGPKTGVNEVYDPSTDKWETKASMPTPRDDFAIAVYQNKIYCIGGYSVDGYAAVNEVYDPATNTWETKALMATAKIARAAIVNSKIYLMGGNPNNTLNQVYDPAMDSWEIKASMPTQVDGDLVVIDNKIYFLGGSYLEDGIFHTLNQIYDAETDAWTQGANPPEGGVKRGTVLLTTGEFAPKRIYISDTRLRIYDPEGDNWTLSANKNIDRLNMAVVVLNDKLYAIGGNAYTYPDPTRSIGEKPIITTYTTNEEYTPFGYGIPDPSYSSAGTPSNIEAQLFLTIALSGALATVVFIGLLLYLRKCKS